MKEQSKLENLFWTSVVNLFFLTIGLIGIGMLIYAFYLLSKGQYLLGIIVGLISAFPLSFGKDILISKKNYFD